MKKTPYILLALATLVVVFASACGGSAPAAAPATQPPAQQPPVQAPAGGETQPTQAAPAAPAFAPACQTTTSCAAPAISDTEPSNTFCVEKVPYQNLSVDPGTTFEVIDPKGELKCQDSGTVVDGKAVITCTGKELWTYELKLTNSSCGGSTLQAGTANCAEGQGYDAAQNCCAPLTSDSGSVTIKINMGACPLPSN